MKMRMELMAAILILSLAALVFPTSLANEGHSGMKMDAAASAPASAKVDNDAANISGTQEPDELKNAAVKIGDIIQNKSEYI